MKKYVSTVLYISCMLILYGCSKELNIKYKDIEPLTVIEGSVTQYGANVRITLTTPMDEPMDTTPITNAVVILTDLTSGIAERLVVDKQGNYSGCNKGIEGHMYELSVEQGGLTYRATGEMSAPTEIMGLTFNWIKMPYDNVAVLQVTFIDNDPNAYGYYWVRLYRNGEAYMWNLVSDKYVANGIINDIFMTSRRDLEEEDDATALHDGDIISASVTPISLNMYDYLEAVSSDSNGPALFSGDFCLGYFLVAPVAESSVIFRPDIIPEY